MYSTPDQPQQWSVHAEFTISHPGVCDPQNPATTTTVQDENAVRMQYSWTGNENHPSEGSTKSSHLDSERMYGFQRGNLLFTSTPPTKPHPPVFDSGYGSDLMSSSSLGSSKGPAHPYHRKCKSTCNIILTSNGRQGGAGAGREPCGRTQSLRCQTPSACWEKRTEGFYGCGDPWCHHADEFIRRVSPVREVCEDQGCGVCNSAGGGAAKRDVSVQTYEMVSKCTSPMSGWGDSGEEGSGKGRSLLRRGRTVGRKKIESPETARSNLQRDLSRLSRSSSIKSIPPPASEKKYSGSDNKSVDSSKKPRTIHIDVYCTGTEIESDSDSSCCSANTKSASTPQTVFESEKVVVTRQKADEAALPHRFCKSAETSVEHEESDLDDGLSTAYPSKMSSLATMGRSLTSMSSFPNSLSSCTVPDYESSLANTSWKDTVSDMDSLIHSRGSMAQNDSSYFLPKRIEEEKESICESPKTCTTNSLSLQPSDSFEYANSEDRSRIRRMERLWKAKKAKALDHDMKLQETLNRKLSRINVSKDSDSELSDEEETGWTFLKSQPKSTQGLEKLVESKLSAKQGTVNQPVIEEHEPVVAPDDGNCLGSLSDSGTSPCKSPSTVIFRQRLSLDPNLRSPFTILPGKYTEQRFIAKKFGPIISVYKKPGHHIGPAKNPDCSCDHCRRHFHGSGRTRTSSVGDCPRTLPNDWKGFVKPGQRFSDF